MKEIFVIGSAIDLAFDFQDMNFSQLNTIEVTIAQRDTAVLFYSKAAGTVVSGTISTYAYLTIPAADSAGLTCGDFDIQIKYVFLGSQPYIVKVVGGTMIDGY
jgi:hypothetical protein